MHVAIRTNRTSDISRRFALATAASLVLACSAAGRSDIRPDASSCPAGFLGDAARAPDFETQVLLADGTVTTLHDGATVPLLLPPQGGRVLFAGVRATNVDGCGLRLTVELRDLASGQVRIDSRKIDLIEDANGWGVSATSGAAGISAVIASFSNLAACPNDWSTTDLNGHQFGLDVSIEDTNGRQAMKSFRVTPSCAQPENFNMCLCICKAGYMPGTPCPS